MSSPNLFNVLTNGSSGDHEILPATPDQKIRVRQLCIQNKDLSQCEVSIKNSGQILIGPVTLQGQGFFVLELASEEYENFFVLSTNSSLVINVNNNNELLVFGWSTRY